MKMPDFTQGEFHAHMGGILRQALVDAIALIDTGVEVQGYFFGIMIAGENDQVRTSGGAEYRDIQMLHDAMLMHFALAENAHIIDGVRTNNGED